MIIQSPEFQTNGQFDYNKYLSALSDPNRDWTALESYYRQDLPKQKLQSLVMAAVKISDADIRRQFEDENVKAKVAYAFVPATNFPVDKESIDDATARAYYEAHKSDYRTDAQAWVQQVRIEKKPDRLRLAGRPRPGPAGCEGGAGRRGLRRARQRLLRGSAATARGRARDLPDARSDPGARRGRSRLQSSGRAVQRRDPGPERLPHPQGRGPQDRGVEGRGEVRRHLRADRLVFGESLAGYQDRAFNLARAAQEAGTSLADAAAADGLSVTDLPPFGRNGFVRGVGDASGFMDWAFNAAAGSTTAMEAVDGWYIVRLVRRRDPGVAPIDEVMERVKTDCAVAQQVEQAKQAALTILESTRGGSPLETASKLIPNSTFGATDEFAKRGFARGLGNDPLVMDRVFSDPIGLVPQVVTTKRGAYVIEILTRGTVDESALAAARESIRQQISQRQRREILTRWIEQLRSQAKIEDFRFESQI